MTAKIYKKCIEYCHLRVCNSNLHLFSIRFSFFFFFRTDTMCSSSSHQASLQRHSVFLYRLSFECPTLRLLAGLVDDWQIIFKKFLGVRCAQCNSFYRISSLLTTVMLSSLISRNRLVSMHFFFLQSFAASISHGSICRWSCC